MQLEACESWVHAVGMSAATLATAMHVARPRVLRVDEAHYNALKLGEEVS